MSGQTKWTPEQRQAIETVGTSLLVSAAAGSGKTSVLAERCVHLVCDAQERCGIRELLVVTFTEAAAAEMKKRITDRLIERSHTCGESETQRLRGELMLVEQANISTLHSFCLRLIRQNFHRLDLDPAARVIDQDEAALLRSETVKEIFAERYESGDDDFAKFIEAYGDGRDENLMDLVLRTQALMESLVDPVDWRRRALERMEQAANLPLVESEMGQEFLALLKDDLAALIRLARQAAEQMPGDFRNYQAYLRQMAAILESWQAKTSRGYDAFAREIQEGDFGKAPRYSDDIPGKAEAKAAVDRVKKAIEDFRGLVIFSEDEWRGGIKAIYPHANTFLSLVEEFATRYQIRKRELSGLDFADQERFALRLLQMPEAAAACHAQFKHVLVDEYQDINSVQEAILAAAGRGDNQFCVGDVKQSIYRFRLAEPGKFLEKSKAFGGGDGGRRIDLNCNFRSRAGLLEAINGVFKCLMSEAAAEIEYDQSHWLNSGAEYPSTDELGFSGWPIELHVLEKQGRGEAVEDELDRTEREALFTALRIREMVEVEKRTVCRKIAGRLEAKPLEYGDIAILLRATSQKTDYFADALRAQNIAVRTDRGSGFFEAVEIRDMLALLSLLDNQQQDVPLASVLRSPIGGFNADDLARIRLANVNVPFHRAARMYADKAKDELGKKLKEFFAQLTTWRELAQRRPLAEVVWKILTQTGYLTFCAGLSDGPQRQANLLHFHQRCQQYGRFGHGLYRFLRFVEKLQEEQETARPTMAEAQENAVQLMSIHAAKGLEFPVVFVPDLGKTHNFADKHGSILAHRRAYLGLAVPDEIKQIRYPSLAQVLIKRKVLRETLAEELRLLYVAMTRAKEHLVLLGTGDLSAMENWQRFAEHQATVPPEQFLSGRTMLDWIGPAVAILQRSNAQMFELEAHPLAEMGSWREGSQVREQFSARQQQLAQLQAIEASPNDLAERIIARLEFAYPQQNLTRLAAVRSVSAVSKDGVPLAVEMDGDIEADGPAFETPVLQLPRWLSTASRPGGIEIGSATHRVLQYLDFSHASTRLELEQQIHSLIIRRLLSEEEKAAVQIDSILWLMSTEIGGLLRTHSARILRELSIYFPCDPGKFDESARGEAADQVMLRGRLDAAIDTNDGLVLLDYKTDRVEKERIVQCAPAYERQINFYRDALIKIGGRKVIGAYLIFLTPCIVRRV